MRKQDDHTCRWSRWWAYVTLFCLMAVAFPCSMAAGPEGSKAPQKALPSAAPDVKLKLTPKQLAALNTGFSSLLQQRQVLLQSNTTSQQPGNSSNPISTAGSYLNSLVNKLNQEVEESEQRRIKYKHGHKRREHHHRHEDSAQQQTPQYEPEAQPEYHGPAPGPDRPWAHGEPLMGTQNPEEYSKHPPYSEQKGYPEQQDRHYLQHSDISEHDSDEPDSRHNHQHYPEPEELHGKTGPRHSHRERREPSYERPTQHHSPDAEDDSPIEGHRQRSRQDAEEDRHEHGDDDRDEDDARHAAPKSAVLCVRESYRKACSLSDAQDERQTVYYTSKLECCPGNGEVDDSYQGAPMPEEAAVKAAAVTARKKGVVSRATQIRVPSPHPNKSGCSWKVTYLDEPEKLSPTISRIGFGVAVCQFTEEIETCSGVACKGLKFKAKVDVFKTSAISEYPPPAGGLDGTCSDVYDHIGLQLADASDHDVSSAANAKQGKTTDEVRTAEYNMFYDSLIAQGPGQRIYGGEAVIMTGPISAIYVRPGEPSVKYKSGMLEHVAAFSGRVLSTAEMLELPKDTPFVKPKAYKLLMVPSQNEQ